MPESTSNSIVNLGNVSKPADTLIKKISNAVGGVFAPWQIKRIAQAEAEATIIKAQADIEITDLQRRAMRRFFEEEAQRQKNIEDITAKALPQLNAGSDPTAMEDDWITNFFEKSRIVSDGDMQNLWSRVLAGEANKPGSYSKRTVNFLSDLDKIDAELFSKLCGFGWVIGNFFPLVFDYQAEIYTKNGIGFETLSHLDTIGLIQFSSVTALRQMKLPKRIVVHYYANHLILEMSKDSGNELQVGMIVLTKTGQQLAPICGSKPVDGFWNYVCDTWRQHIPKLTTEKGAEEPKGASGHRRLIARILSVLYLSKPEAFV